MKAGKWILGLISVIGGFLVGEGLISGEELTSMQNVIGLALGGGGVSIAMVISIIQAFPKTLVQEGYNKAVATYGQAKVDSVINNFDLLLQTLQTVNSKLDNVQDTLNAQEEARNNLLNG